MTTKRSTTRTRATATTAKPHRTAKQSPPLAPVADFPLDQLLEAGDAAPSENARALAAQIRAAAQDLRRELDNGAAIADAQAQIERARAQLAQAEAALAQLTGEADLRPEPEPEPAEERAAPIGEDVRHSNAVRDWARENGLSVGARGRIADDVIAAFNAAH